MTTDARVQPPRPALTRPARGRVLAGVAQGVATHLGVDVTAVRVLLAVAGLAGGAGVAVYGFLWAFVPEAPQVEEDLSPADRAFRRSVRAQWVVVGGLALAAVGLAIALGVEVDVWGWLPLVVIAAGAVFAWSQLDATARRRLPEDPPRRRATVLRVGAGVALAVVGLLLLTTRGLALAQVWSALVAVLVTLAGVAVIVAPYAARLWADLRSEQAARIRATERADIAAHLHDSVLQTLTLIQRRSEDPQLVRLARAQERELRHWLYAGPPGAQATLASAVADVAHEVEDRHGIPIDLVVTGDHPLGAGPAALVAALREALVNASMHAAPPISAYVEVGPERVEAFVRDHGPGFEPAAVPADRLGVRESILGRMRRHGGSARVRRLDDGTEVSLTLPVERAGDGDQVAAPDAGDERVGPWPAVTSDDAETGSR